MQCAGFLADFSRNEMVSVEVEDIWAFWVARLIDARVIVMCRLNATL